MNNRRPSRPNPPTVARRSRLPVVAVALGLAGLLLGGGALAITLLRGNDQGCREIAWSALPAQAALPSGWTMSASGIYIDSVGTTLSGPTPSASDQEAPSIFVSVGCYGTDAHDGLVRSHVVALSEGATDVTFPALGDESAATVDQATGEYQVLVRRGALLATLAAAGTIALPDLESAARAVDEAMASAPTAARSSLTLPPSAAAVASPSPGGSGGSSDQPTSHAAPALEKLLPTSVAGVTLETASYAASDVLGSDPSSQALTDALKALGKTPQDLRIAEGYDSAATSDWYVDAFQLPGITGSKLAEAITGGWLGGSASGTKTTTVTIAGKRVTKLDHGADTPADYVYVHGDVVFDVASSDATTARQVLAALP